jgi:hypothetical protein
MEVRKLKPGSGILQQKRKMMDVNSGVTDQSVWVSAICSRRAKGNGRDEFALDRRRVVRLDIECGSCNHRFRQS